MKVLREATTTSPSVCHLGHYKRLCTVINKSLESDKRKELKEIQAKIPGCFVAMITFMIYKEQDNMKIHRLRVIHIKKADYNFLTIVEWREAIQHVQQLGKINQG